MKNWTIGKRIISGFVLVLIIVAVLGVFNLSRLVAIDSRINLLATDSVPGLQLVNAMNAIALENDGIV